MQPDCVGFEINLAKRRLEQSGVTGVEISVTQPPRGGIPGGDARVVRQRLLENGTCQLVIAYREYREQAK